MDSPVNKEEDMETASQNEEDVPKLDKADIESDVIDKEDNKQSVKELESNENLDENSIADESVQDDDCENMPNIRENDDESVMQCSENEQHSDALKTETNFSEVKVQLIDIPEGEDLFDLLNNSQSVKEDELKKTELYKYLTEENRLNQQMEEITPYQSGDDEDSEDSTSSDSDDSSSSDEEYEETEVEKAGIESKMMGKDTSLQEDSKEEVSKDVRRNPERKSNLKKPSKIISAGKAKELSKRTLERLEQSKLVTNRWLKDLSIPENLTFCQPIKLNSEDLNQYLTCGLCKGYLYEASTITECMHTFCKNCIVRHCMEVSLHCPVCSILIHPTDPFVNIRLDRMIQDIVYKILPRVAETEMKRIEDFYAEHPEVQPKEIHNPLPIPKAKVSPKETKVPEPTINAPSLVSLFLEAEEQYESQEILEKKFVRVTSCATVGSVCEFLKKKLSLQDKHAVDIFCCGDAMEETQCTLETIKQNFFGDQEDLMLLQYRIRET